MYVLRQNAHVLLVLTGTKLSLTGCGFLLFPSCEVYVFCFCFSNKIALKLCVNCKKKHNDLEVNNRLQAAYHLMHNRLRARLRGERQSHKERGWKPEQRKEKRLRWDLLIGDLLPFIPPSFLTTDTRFIAYFFC